MLRTKVLALYLFCICSSQSSLSITPTTPPPPPAYPPKNHITVLKQACTQFLGVRWLFKLATVHQPSTTQRADERGGTGRMWARRCCEFGLYYLDVNTRIASPQMWLPFCAQINEHFSPGRLPGPTCASCAGGAELWLRFYVQNKEEDVSLSCSVHGFCCSTQPHVSQQTRIIPQTPVFPPFIKWYIENYISAPFCFTHSWIYSYDY